MGYAAERKTVKGHGLSVGDKVNYHGHGNVEFPAVDPTLCILGKDGNKYTLTSVNDMDPTGKPWVWTFGASTQVWVSLVEKVEITEHISDGVTLYSGKCAHGWTTGLYADRDDAITVAAGHGEVSIPTYEPATVDADAVLLHFTEVCMLCQVSPREVTVEASQPYLGSMLAPQLLTLHTCVPCRDLIMANRADTDGYAKVEVVWIAARDLSGVTISPKDMGEPLYRVYLALTGDGADVMRRRLSPRHVTPWASYLVEITAPAVDTPDIAGYRWQRHVGPFEHVTEDSTYQLVKDGTSCQVAAVVKRVKGGLWQASGCVWMSTGLTSGSYWDGEPLADAFAHVVQYMAWVESVRGSGLSWADINRLDWRTPYVAAQVVNPGDTVYRDRDGAQGTVRNVLKYGALDVMFEGGAGFIRTVAELKAEGFEIIPAAEVAEGEAAAIAGSLAAIDNPMSVTVKPMSPAVVDLLFSTLPCVCDKIIDAGRSKLPRRGSVQCPCGVFFCRSVREITSPVRTKLNRRARKASKRAKARKGGE